MEAIFIYFLKTNALITIFFLAYYFLVQKDTFFNSNRWFLQLGLLTSIVIPACFIKKTVLINVPVHFENNVISMAPIVANNTTAVIEDAIDWFQIGTYIYGSMVLFLLFKIVSELVSLYKLIKNKQIIRVKSFAMVDIDDNISPFSFFKYIVFNSTKYTKIELKNIIAHERVHSKEKHSVDVLIAKLFCTLFWFNPFVWLYKKAIVQNLEYIADQNAFRNAQDKKAYQMTLLKVVTDQNCLSITNSFYQSLIKKRIVMLNKNQSKQRNVWKYAIILPVLAAFVIFFQVKIVAQEGKAQSHVESLKEKNYGVIEMIISKKNTDQEIAQDFKTIKEFANIDLKLEGIKRNSEGEITGINITSDDHKGTKGSHIIEGDESL
jgi:hypothetical protein